MLSSVLRSPRAIAVNIEIMRAFVQLRRLLDSNAELARKVAELERKYDGKFRAVFEAIRQLMAPSATSGKRIAVRTLFDHVAPAMASSASWLRSSPPTRSTQDLQCGSA
jgi:hypothetical protein